MNMVTDSALTARQLPDTVTPRINKVIEITARNWFDKSGGNTYYAAYVNVWDSAEYQGCSRFILPFGIGSESQGKYDGLRKLFKLGLIPSEREHELRAAGILVLFSASDRPKRDLPTVSSCERAGMPRVAPNVPVFIAN